MKNLIIGLVLSCCLISSAAADPFRPPPGEDQPRIVHQDNGFSYPSGILLSALSFFQKTIGRVDGDRCSMSPSCSNYAKEAVHRYGPLAGIMMTVDRLYHEQGLAGEVPAVVVDEKIRWCDPVEANHDW